MIFVSGTGGHGAQAICQTVSFYLVQASNLEATSIKISLAQAIENDGTVGTTLTFPPDATGYGDKFYLSVECNQYASVVGLSSGYFKLTGGSPAVDSPTIVDGYVQPVVRIMPVPEGGADNKAAVELSGWPDDDGGASNLCPTNQLQLTYGLGATGGLTNIVVLGFSFGGVSGDFDIRHYFYLKITY